MHHPRVPISAYLVTCTNNETSWNTHKLVFLGIATRAWKTKSTLWNAVHSHFRDSPTATLLASCFDWNQDGHLSDLTQGWSKGARKQNSRGGRRFAMRAAIFSTISVRRCGSRICSCTSIRLSGSQTRTLAPWCWSANWPTPSPLRWSALSRTGRRAVLTAGGKSGTSSASCP